MTLPLPIPDIFDSDEKWEAYERRLTPDELDELEAYLDAIHKMDDATIQQLKGDVLDERRMTQLKNNKVIYKIHKILDDAEEKRRMKLWENVRKQRLQERLERGNVEGQTKLFGDKK